MTPSSYNCKIVNYTAKPWERTHRHSNQLKNRSLQAVRWVLATYMYIYTGLYKYMKNVRIY